MGCNCENNKDELRIVRGNSFHLRVQVTARRLDGTIIEDFDLGAAEPVLKMICGGSATAKPMIVEGNDAIIYFDGKDKLGWYGMEMSGTYESEAWRWCVDKVFQIVNTNAKGNVPEWAFFADDTYTVAGIFDMVGIATAVQSDWDETDPNSPAFILNKPDLSIYANKVSGATAGNFAGLNSAGNLVDSGKKAADFATAAQGAKADAVKDFAKNDIAFATGSPGDDIDPSKLNFDGRVFDKQNGNDNNSVGLNGINGFLTTADMEDWDYAGNYALPTVGAVRTKVNEKYTKPQSGIPKSDLASGVQTSLDKADAAVQDVSGKADKVSGATAGDFAGLDANGNLVDSGKKASDFATAADLAATNANVDANAENISDLQSAYAGLTQSDIVVGALPISGVANTIYRVPSTSSYSDYMWDGSQFVLLATYNNNGIAEAIGYYSNTDNAHAVNKTISASGYILIVGSNIKVKFTNYNSAANPTLNINSTGAKPLYYNGAIASPTNTWSSGDVVNIYYDGTNYYATPLTPSVIPHRFYENVNVNYEACILDFWLDPSLLDASIMRINFRSYGTSYYLRAYNGASSSDTLWTITDSTTNLSNNTLIPFVLTINDVEKTIGYVVFKDIATFKTNTTSSSLDLLNLSYIASDIREHCYIYKMLNDSIGVDAIDTANIKNNAITSAKIADGNVRASKIPNFELSDIKLSDKFLSVDLNYDIRGTIRELYLYPDSIKTGYANIVVKNYVNTIYIRTTNDAKSEYGWQVELLNSSLVNGVVYPLVVSVDGANTSYPVGKVVGYIIFKDIATLKANNKTGNPFNGINANITNITQNPVIYSYLNKNAVLDLYPHLQVPSDIYIVAGDELRIYWRSILKSATPNKYDVRAVSGVGRSYPKYYWLKTDVTGDYSVNISLYDESNTAVRTATTTIHVIAAMSQPASNTNILVFGASATASGYIAGELRRRLTTNTGDGTSQNPTGLNLGNITFVGRKTGTAVTDIHQEATGGWSWKNYAGEGRAAYRFQVSGVININIDDTYKQGDLTFTITEVNVTSGTGEIRCTYAGTGTPTESGTLTRKTGTGDASITYSSYESESYNPFWNPNKTGGAGLDFINYANEYCNGTIDVIISHCGINDMKNYTTETMDDLFTDYIKPFVRAFHTDFPSGKFIASTLPLPSPTGGMGANYGASEKWNYTSMMQRFLKFAELFHAMAAESEFSGYLTIADDVPVFDAEHSYPYEMASVNTRSTTTEERGTNGVHPVEGGSYQVSDAIYAIINNII